MVRRPDESPVSSLAHKRAPCSVCILVNMKSLYKPSKLFSCLAAVAACLTPSCAQRADDAKTPLAFEVATIKPDAPGQAVMIELRVYPGGRLIIHGHPLRWLIAEAFDLPDWQVVGGEKWMNQRLFDIEGKPPEEFRNAIPGGEFSIFGIHDARVRTMLKALLIERFHLKFHVETQPGTVYLLKRGDGPLRLEPSEISLYKRSEDGSVKPSNAYPTGDIGIVTDRGVSIHQTSMRQLAHMLSSFQKAPVSDQTGLPDFYNFRSKTIVTKEDFHNGAPVHLLAEVVPEMGLKLVKAEGKIEKFVIDSVDPPLEN
jgi:uncharacterized protein (TIGR03435 family)